MNKSVTFIVLIIVSFLINILQATIFAPSTGQYFSPDLNLIFIIFIAVSKDIRFGLVLAILNGFLLDVMSGYMLGINTLSRLSLYLILRRSSNHFDYENYTPVFISLFLGTLYVWAFIWFILLLKSVSDLKLNTNIIIYQAIINSAIGIFLFHIKNKIYATIQE
jgi:rod shape-determining protein MreD